MGSFCKKSSMTERFLKEMSEVNYRQDQWFCSHTQKKPSPASPASLASLAVTAVTKFMMNYLSKGVRPLSLSILFQQEIGKALTLTFTKNERVSKLVWKKSESPFFLKLVRYDDGNEMKMREKVMNEWR